MKPSDLGLPADKFPSFRSYAGFDQLAAAQELSSSPERFQILNASTGSGKSGVGAAVAGLMAIAKRARDPESAPFRWLVLTGTKGLQHQWHGDGLVQRSVVGHRNYPCMSRGFVGGDGETDDPEFRCAAFPKSECGYLRDTTALRDSQSGVGNYAHWLSLGRYSDPDLLGEFDLLILDEAHSAPSWLTNAMQIYLSPMLVGRLLGHTFPYKMPDHRKVEGWHQWACETRMAADSRRDCLIAAKDAPGARRLTRLIRDLDELVIASDPDSYRQEKLHEPRTEPWIVIPQSDRPGFIFSPRWGSDFAERYLFRGIPHILLTSATVTPQHARYLGIEISEMKYREAPSPFDVRRRPVLWCPTTRVDFKMTDGARFQLWRRVDELIEAAMEQGAGNGIIHTGSYERMRELVAQSKWAPAIMTHRQDSAHFQSQLDQFKSRGRAGQFAIMASPRMVEGVDLPGVEARWQLLLKMPFGDSRDPLEAARMEDAGYRMLVLMEKVMQALGRINRGDWDFGTSLILDDHWEYLKWSVPFPGWLKASFGKVGIGPDGRAEIEFLVKAKVDALPVVAAPRVVQLIQP
jgi:Rad3-related DNA helicase